jgi:hypothetical protein
MLISVDQFVVKSGTPLRPMTIFYPGTLNLRVKRPSYFFAIAHFWFQVHCHSHFDYRSIRLNCHLQEHLYLYSSGTHNIIMIQAIAPSVQKNRCHISQSTETWLKNMFYAMGRVFPSMLQSHAIWTIKFQP